MLLAAGMRIDDLVLLAPLGRGAQGSVWRARREGSGETVAVKLLKLRGTKDGFRAKREAVVLSQLRHPSLPRCKRMIEGLDDGWMALELELVDGKDLGEASTYLDVGARRSALLHVARALAHLHALGVVHRDVKPANIVVAHDFAAAPDDPARCKLVDLGIAIRTGNPAPLTLVGHPGTLPFMAPEALLPTVFPYPAGKPTLDVFAFGVTGWRVLRDRHPTGLGPDPMTEDLVAAYADHAGAEHLFLPPEDVSDPFERVLAACVRLRADQRPPDAGAVVAMLEDAKRASGTPGPAATRTHKAERTEPAPGPPVRPPPVAPTLRDDALLPSVVLSPPSPARRPSAPVARRAAPSPVPVATRVKTGRNLFVVLGIVSLLATVATFAVVTLGGRPTSNDAFTTVERATIVPANPTVPTTRLSADLAPRAPDIAPRGPASPPPSEWAGIGESNVRHSTALGCETKVRDGWFRARCVHPHDVELEIRIAPSTRALVRREAGLTTLLVPLEGRDIEAVFDWKRGRGVRALHIVGHPVEHRAIQSQGEFSAP